MGDMDRGPGRARMTGWTLFALLVVMAAMLLVPTGGRAAGPGLPLGRWTTYANGDDILSLAWEAGQLWAGTRHGGLVQWDPIEGSYTQYLRPQDPLAGNTVYDIAIDAGGVKWLATDGGLTRFDDAGTPSRADDSWHTYTRANSGGGLPSDLVKALALDGPRLWIGCQQELDPLTGVWSGGGLARLDTKGTDDPGDDGWAPVATYDNTLRGLPDGSVQLGLVSDNIMDLALTAKGGLWVATAQQHRLEQAPDTTAPRIWARVGGGVSHRDTKGSADPADDRWTAARCDGDAPTVSCQVETVALDAGGRLWIGMAGRGLRYANADQPSLVDDPSQRFDPSEGQGGNTVTAIAFGPADQPALANTVWMATQCNGACLGRRGGLSILDHKGSLLGRNDDVWDFGRGAPFSGVDGMARDRAQALIIAGGTAWIGTGPASGVGGGVNRMALASASFGSNLLTACSQPGCVAPPTNFFTDLAVGAAGSRWEGHVWAASGSRAAAARQFGSGLLDLDTRGSFGAADDVWKVYNTVNTDPDGKVPWTGLTGNNVHAVMLRGDQVWAGSATTAWDGKVYSDGGLAVFDGSRWTARTVASTKRGNVPGLRSNGVTALAAGCGNEVWAATGSPWDVAGTGLDRLKLGASVHDAAADAWTAFSYPKLPSNNLTDVALDCAAGTAWVAAAHHLSEPDPISGTGGGRWTGGGVGAGKLSDDSWARFDVTSGLESFGENGSKGEAFAVLPAPDGGVWAGTLGSKGLSAAAMVAQKPYFTAQLNRRTGSTWSKESFVGAGWISGIARDGEGRLWVATSRGGLAREAADPEGWRTDRRNGGLRVHDGAAWRTLDVAGSGIPSNDISAVAVAPNGDVWIATDGWGMARFAVGAATPTPTSTVVVPTLEPSPTTPATLSPTPGGGTVEPTPTAVGGTAATPTRTPTLGGSGTPGASQTPLGRRLWLPFLIRAARVRAGP